MMKQNQGTIFHQDLLKPTSPHQGICVLCFCLWLVLFALEIWTTYAAALPPCDLDKEFPTTRPSSPEGCPTTIHVKSFLFDLVDIVTVQQEFTLNLFLHVKWEDPRVGALLRQAGVRRCEANFNAIKHPGLRILNARSIRFTLPEI
jgi:hypothetical protein